MKTTKHTLPNGMAVLLEENHSSPVISYNILVKAGSAIERDKEAGLCHVIEHMIFKGTPARPVGAIARDVEASGGDINAYTSFDQTVFYINMASRFSDKGLEILADAVKNPLFDAEELAREKEVILEEIRRSKDNPAHEVSERLFRGAYTRHTYGRPIIGFAETVKSFTREKVVEFYRKWYSPANMTCIVVGDFNSAEMIKKIEQAFADFTSTLKHSNTQTLAAEPPQTSPRINTTQMNIQAAYFMIGFHIPHITHEEIPALDILSHILGGVHSSRLEQEVKEKRRLVHTIYSYAFTPRHAGLFIIGGIMQTARSISAIKAIWEEIYKISTEPPSADELTRAKTNIRSAEIYERETVGGEAAKLAYFLATADDHEFEKRYFQMINDITADGVRAVAQKYLTHKNSTIDIIYPKGPEKKPAAADIETACTTKTEAKGQKKTAKEYTPKLYRLKNGARLIIRENHTLPIVAAYAITKGGLRYETPEINGISHLFSHTITKGTEVRSALEVSKKIESIAGSIEGMCGRNSVGLRVEFLSEKLYDGFGLFAEVLCKPAFDEKEVSKERAQQLEEIEHQEDNLASMAFVHFLKALYGRHPYGLRMLGEKASVKRLTSSALKRYWQTHLNPKNLVISAVGDVSPSEIKDLAERWMKIKGPSKKASLKEALLAKPEGIITTEQKKKEKEQSHIVLGFLGPKLKSPDHYKMIVLNNILSGQGGRLFVTLRDRMGLAYAVNSVSHSGVEPGYFAVYIGTEPSKAGTAVKGIIKELKHLQTEMATEEELDRAHQYLIGTYELDQQRNIVLASSYAINELYDLGIDEVERYPKRILGVTRKDILATARRYINLDAYVLSVIKPG